MTKAERKRLLAIRLGMIARCYNPKHDSYEDYGKRGIRVCERWIQSRQAFIDDVGPRPTPRHSLDRRENDGHYEPSNVRWATSVEQANNTRRSKRTRRGEGLRQQAAAAVREARLALNLSQEECAARFGVSIRALRDMERGTARMTALELAIGLRSTLDA